MAGFPLVLVHLHGIESSLLKLRAFSYSEPWSFHVSASFLVQLLLDSVFTRSELYTIFSLIISCFFHLFYPENVGPLVGKLLSVSRWSQQNAKLSMEPFWVWDPVWPREASGSVKITAPLPIPSFLILFSPPLLAFEKSLGGKQRENWTMILPRLMMPWLTHLKKNSVPKDI